MDLWWRGVLRVEIILVDRAVVCFTEIETDKSIIVDCAVRVCISTKTWN